MWRSCSVCWSWALPWRAPGFLSPTNVSNVLVQSTLLLLLSLPMTLVIMTEGLDLSMGAVLTLTSIVVAIVSLDTGSMPLGLLAAVGSRNRIRSCERISCRRAEYPAVCGDARNPWHGAGIGADRQRRSERRRRAAQRQRGLSGSAIRRAAANHHCRIRLSSLPRVCSTIRVSAPTSSRLAEIARR